MIVRIALAALALSISPALADSADIQSAIARTPEAMPASTMLDDCLAKAVSKQAPGRPLEPLLRDLINSCATEIAHFDEVMTKKAGLSEERAHDALYYLHLAPVAFRTNPK